MPTFVTHAKMIFRLTEEEFLKIAEMNVEALNEATAGLPSNKVLSSRPQSLPTLLCFKLRMHLCWGNWHGPHHRDIPIEKIFKV